MKNSRSIQTEINRLGERYKEYFDFYERKSIVAKTRGVQSEDLYALGTQLENFESYVKFFEESGSSYDNLGVLPNIALDVITASQAQSVVPMIAAVQPMQEQTGTIYFKNVIAGSTRGNINKGSTLLSARDGRKQLARGFSSEEVYGEATGAVGDGSTTTFTFAAAYFPIRKRSIEIVLSSGGSIKAIDDGSGNLLGIGCTGTINYETGDVSVTFSSAPSNGSNVLLSYATNFEIMDEIPTIRSEFDSISVKARTFALRSDIGMFQNFSIQKRFNMDASEIMAKDLTTEITSEVSSAVVLEAYLNAVGNTNWSKTAPTGVSYTEHKLTFFDAIAYAETLLLANAGRAGANQALVCGTGASAILRTLPGFVPFETQNSVLGTHYFGTLDGKPIIRSTAIPSEKIILTSRGSGMFDAATVYAPYLPLFITDLAVTGSNNPLRSQRGIALQSAIKAVVPQLSTIITIVP